MQWIMRDGTPIEITEMTDSHLENALRMLFRNVQHHQSILDCGGHTYSQVLLARASIAANGKWIGLLGEEYYRRQGRRLEDVPQLLEYGEEGEIEHGLS